MQGDGLVVSGAYGFTTPAGGGHRHGGGSGDVVMVASTEPSLAMARSPAAEMENQKS